MKTSPNDPTAGPPFSLSSPLSNFLRPAPNSEAAKFPPQNGVSVVASPSVPTGFTFGARLPGNTSQQPPTYYGFPSVGSNSSSLAAYGVQYPTRNFGIVRDHSPAHPSMAYLASSDLGSSPCPNKQSLDDRRGRSRFLANGPLPAVSRSSSDSPPVRALGALGPSEFFPRSTDAPSSSRTGYTSSLLQSSPASSQGVQKERVESCESVERPGTVPPEGELLSTPPSDSGKKGMNSDAQNASITPSPALKTNRKIGSENKRDRDESPETDKQEKEDVDTNSSPARKRTKSSVRQNPRCEYHYTSPRRSDSNLPIVHAVITTRRYRRNGCQRYRLEKLFSDQKAATEFAEEWTRAKFSKYEDDVRGDDLDVLGKDKEIGYYTPSDWNEASGMSFGAFVQRRVLE